MYTAPDPAIIRTDLDSVFRADLPWKDLAGKKVIVTGASGMIAAYLVDALLALPERFRCDSPSVIAIVRNAEKARSRFAAHLSNPALEIRTADIRLPLDANDFIGASIVIHAASIPRPDAKHPVDVMAPNLLGTWNLLQLARRLEGFEQFLFFSSGIVNGEQIQSDIPITEEMYFASSCTSPAACYSEGKRAGETLTLSFFRQYGIPAKILRYFGTYGPGMDLENDPRAFTSFIRNAVAGEDIVLLSAGEETRFWCYLSDATDAFFRVLFLGADGEVYNVANDEAGSTIRELAQTACELSPVAGTSLRFESAQRPAGYASFQSPHITVPGTGKLRALGYAPAVSMPEGLKRTIAAYHRTGA